MFSVVYCVEQREKRSWAGEVPAHLSCIQLKYPNFFFPSEWCPFQPLLILHGELVLPHMVWEVLSCPCCPSAHVPSPGWGSLTNMDCFQHGLTGIQRTDNCPGIPAFCWMQVPPGAAHFYIRNYLLWSYVPLSFRCSCSIPGRSKQAAGTGF